MGGYGVSIKKALNISFTSWGYGIVIMCIVLLLGYSIPISTIIKNLITPLYPYGYWFISTFVAFYLLLPVLRIAVDKMSSKGLLYTSIVGGILIPTYNFFFENVGGTLAYFCYIFVLIGYLKSKEQNWIDLHRRIIFLISTLINVGCILGGCFISKYFGGEAVLNQLTRFHDSRNIITLLQGISLFYIFKKLKPFGSKTINDIAKTALGTYLITENIIIRGDSDKVSLLWNNLFHFADMYKGKLFIPYSIGIILLVFICTIVIDYSRICILKKMRFKSSLLDRIDQKCFECFNSNNG